jgi:hypothetical protein
MAPGHDGVSLVDVSALLMACSVQVDDTLLASIAYVNGRGRSQQVVDVNPQTCGRSDARNDFAAPSESTRAAVIRILSIGGEPVFGVLPVRHEWASELGRALDDLFDPCTAIAIASSKIADLDYSCRSRGVPRSSARRSCILEAYGRSLLLPGLRRAVLADLTLDAPPTTELGPSLELAATVAPSNSTSSALFFALRPLAPAVELPLDSPPHLPRGDR